MSSNSKILADPDDLASREFLKRWTGIDLRTPAMIILPTSEEDIQRTVQFSSEAGYDWVLTDSTGAVGHQLFDPFVTKSGDHANGLLLVKKA